MCKELMLGGPSVGTLLILLCNFEASAGEHSNFQCLRRATRTPSWKLRAFGHHCSNYSQYGSRHMISSIRYHVHVATAVSFILFSRSLALAPQRGENKAASVWPYRQDIRECQAGYSILGVQVVPGLYHRDTEGNKHKVLTKAVAARSVRLCVRMSCSFSRCLLPKNEFCHA